MAGFTVTTSGGFRAQQTGGGGREAGTLIAGAGDNVDAAPLEGPTTGQALDFRFGTSGSPDASLNPPVKVSRTVSYSAVGNGFWQGVADANSGPIVGQALGTATNQAQIIGVLGAVKQKGTATGLNATGAFSSPDAVGIQGIGYVVNSGAVGAAIGIVGIAHGGVSTVKAVNPMQLLLYNDSGTDSSVSASAQALARGISLYSLGANLGGAGIEIVGPVGQAGSQFDVGVHFTGQNNLTRTDANCATNGTNVVTDAACVAADFNKTVTGGGFPANTVITGVTPGVSFTTSAATAATASGVSLVLAVQGPAKTAAIQDDSDALYGLYVTSSANHQAAAIAVGAGAGVTILGASTQNTAGTVLEVIGPAAGQRPVALFGNATNTQNYSVYLRNQAGVYEYFAASTALLTGVGSGDGGIKVATSGKFFHVGGTKSVIKVGNADTLAFFNATAVAQPSRVGQLTDSTGGTVTTTLGAGITDAVAKNAIASLAAKVNAIEVALSGAGGGLGLTA